MKRLNPAFFGLPLIFLMIACSLSGTPATPTPAQAVPGLSAPVIGLQPVSGTPNTLVSISAVGFPASTLLNLYVIGTNNNSQQVATNLTVGQDGILLAQFAVPNQIGSQILDKMTPLTFHLETSDKTLHADAVFIALGNATAQATTTNVSGTTTVPEGNQVANLFITAPAIGSAVAGGAVTVTGSGSAFNNTVGVQVLDANYKIIGSTFATIQAAKGTVGLWQATVSFVPPADGGVGYIVAYTVTSAGKTDQQTSINIALAPTQAPTLIPVATSTNSQPGPSNPIFVTVTPPPSG